MISKWENYWKYFKKSIRINSAMLHKSYDSPQSNYNDKKWLKNDIKFNSFIWNWPKGTKLFL